MDVEGKVREHYAQRALRETIWSALAAGGANDETATSQDLAPIDEFHIGGRSATARLVDRLAIERTMRVLDVGAGIGGAARFVAERFACHVTGVDLTPEYCEVASLLATSLGLAAHVEYRVGSALDMPFDDGTFGAAYMLHVGMNVADKRALFGEVARVLTSGARFGVYDVLAGEGAEEIRFPVPWAASPETSFLASIEELQQDLEASGFEVSELEPRAEFARERLREAHAAATAGTAPGVHVLMGADAETKLANLLANVEAGKCAPWEIVCRLR